MRTTFVIDASVIISWRDPREQNGYGQRILRCLSKESAIAPVICCLEINNVLRLFEKRELISHDTVLETIDFIAALPIRLDDAPIDFRIPRVMELACKYDLTIYDSSYMELAVRLGLPLATMDNKLIEAAKTLGLLLENV